MKKHIDDIFKDKFENFEAPVSDGLWDKIQQNPGWQQHLRRQKIRNLSIYAVLAVIVISSCAVLLHQRNNIENQDVEIQATEEEKLISTPQEPKDTQANISNQVTPEATTDEAITPENSVPEAVVTPTTPIATESASPTEDNTSIIIPVTTEASVPQSSPSPSEKAGVKSEDKATPSQPAGDNTKSDNNKPTGNTEPTTTPAASRNDNPNSSLFSIPNAFTPNGDGLNDVFKPVTAASLQQYQLDIFATNGQHLFTSRNIEYGWNGEFQGSVMNGGNYIYVIKYRDSDGKEHIDKGQLLLIR